MKVIVDERGVTHVDMGWLLKSLISAGVLGAMTAVLTVVIGYPALSQKVEDQSAKNVRLENTQATLAKNQKVIDEQVRNLKADSKWTQEKLDALLEAEGITKRIPRPLVEDSKLE